MMRTRICGEACGERFYAFDLVECAGEDLRAHRYEDRYMRLMRLVQDTSGALPGFEVIPLYVNPIGKSAHLEELRTAPP